ncbi:MAG: SipW-dependent-type signal peptide-containing protein [Clostridium sp.]|nr:SipW-dependent-type signal peptide-containing protein [Clostridium sp.]
MKNVKTLIGSVVLAAGLLGTGYAYWTDSLSVGGTISTGSFDINYVNPQIVLTDGSNITDTELGKSDNWDKNVRPGVDGTYYENGICTIETDEFAGMERVKFKISNLHPGESPVVKFTIKNDGTVKAVVRNSDVSAGESKPYPNTGYYLDAYKFKMSTSLEGLNTANEVVGSTSNLKNEMRKLLADGVEGGAEQDVYIQIAVNEEKSGKIGTEGMDYAAEFDISMMWQQYNRK